MADHRTDEGAAVTAATDDRWIEEAKTQLRSALAALEDERASDIAVFSAIGLAELACHIAWGETRESEWPEDAAPVCTCPPELTAHGGFKGDCPARGVAHG